MSKSIRARLAPICAGALALAVSALAAAQSQAPAQISSLRDQVQQIVQSRDTLSRPAASGTPPAPPVALGAPTAPGQSGNIHSPAIRDLLQRSAALPPAAALPGSPVGFTSGQPAVQYSSADLPSASDLSRQATQAMTGAAAASARGGEFAPAPGVIRANMAPVTVEDSQRILRSRVFPANLNQGAAPAVVASGAKPAGPPVAMKIGGDASAMGPASIPELARSLRHHPDLIYQYVRNNIEYYPIHGIQKGALGAVLDNQGTAHDQATLMVELLRASGVEARFVRGIVRLSAAQRLSDTTLLHQHQVGIVGHTTSPYVDLPSNIVSVAHLGGDVNRESAAFANWGMHLSILESTAVQQTTGVPAVSTVKLIDIAAATGQRIYNAHAANYAGAVQPHLVNCNAHLANFNSYLASGLRLILQLSIAGEYAAYRKFQHDLLVAMPNLVVDRVTMEGATGQAAALDVRLEASLYYRNDGTVSTGAMP